ncbi:MAG: dipeptidase PepE [Sphingorhabdus sp.]
MQLLCLSNSANHSQGFLEHALPWISNMVAPGGSVLFVPFAAKDHEAYTAVAADALAVIGVHVIGAHEAGIANRFPDMDGVVIGGGNCFRLLNGLYTSRLFEPIKHHVRNGMPYIGASAGTNVACPTIMTTNDMPIVAPPTLDAFGFLPFQVNAHYIDPLPGSAHMGETREERIAEFHEEQDRAVIGLREGTGILCQGQSMILVGDTSCRLFRKGQSPVEISGGDEIGSFL